MVTASPDPMVFEAMNSATLPTSVPAASTDRCSPGPSPAMAPARLGMDPSELVADDGQGDWSHDQVALETVRFEVTGDDPSTPSSPGSRRNVTLSLVALKRLHLYCCPRVLAHLSGGSFLFLPRMCVGRLPQQSSFPHRQDGGRRPRSSLQLPGAANAWQKNLATGRRSQCSRRKMC